MTQTDEEYSRKMHEKLDRNMPLIDSAMAAFRAMPKEKRDEIFSLGYGFPYPADLKGQEDALAYHLTGQATLGKTEDFKTRYLTEFGGDLHGQLMKDFKPRPVPGHEEVKPEEVGGESQHE